MNSRYRRHCGHPGILDLACPTGGIKSELPFARRPLVTIVRTTARQDHRRQESTHSGLSHQQTRRRQAVVRRTPAPPIDSIGGELRCLTRDDVASPLASHGVSLPRRGYEPAGPLLFKTGHQPTDRLVGQAITRNDTPRGPTSGVHRSPCRVLCGVAFASVSPARREAVRHELDRRQTPNRIPSCRNRPFQPHEWQVSSSGCSARNGVHLKHPAHSHGRAEQPDDEACHSCG